MRTPRLTFRPFIEQDLANMRLLDADPDVVRFLGHGRVRDIAESKAHLGKIVADHAATGFGLFATELRETGEFIGRTGLIPWRLDGDELWEIGYSLSKKHWGQGFATEASQHWKERGFAALATPYLVSLIQPGNGASIHVAEKIGMRHWKSIEIQGVPLEVYRVDR